MEAQSEDTNVRVAVRCRPFNSKEKNDNESSCVRINGEQIVLVNPQKQDDEHSFAFDIVIDENTAQSTVWNKVGVPILQKAFNGYNGTIFAYGQTGSGKTWSMQGAEGELRGIIPRMNSELFQRIHDETSKRPTMQFLVTVSYFEIYNEVIFDLLDASDRKKKNHAANKGGLEIKEHPVLGVYVKGLQEIVADSESKLQSIIDQGMKNRTTASTQMNADSSRSHSVFMINVHQKDSEDETKNVFAKVNLVDLAGSERVKSTGATGSTLKEGANINKSLSALGNVINALVEASKGKSVFIPYRNSKLTRVLQESLGGNSITAMLAAMSPAASNFEETLSTLKYANRAKAIKVKAVKNEESSQISRLNEEIRLLKEKLASGGGDAIGSGSGNNADISALEEKNRQQLRDLEEARKRTWEEKSKMSKEYEKERQKMLMGQQAAARQLESARQRNWALLEQKGDLEITLGHVRTVLADRNVTGHAAAVLSAWTEEYKSVGALERSLSAQDTIMQIYRSTLSNDSRAFFEQTVGATTKSPATDDMISKVLDTAVVGSLRQLRDKFVAAENEVKKWTFAQNALVDKIDMFVGNIRQINGVAELLKGNNNGIEDTESKVDTVTLNSADEKEILRGLRLIRRQSFDKWQSVKNSVAQSRQLFLVFDSVIVDFTQLLAFYSAAAENSQSTLVNLGVTDTQTFAVKVEEILRKAKCNAESISTIMSSIEKSIQKSTFEAQQVGNESGQQMNLSAASGEDGATGELVNDEEEDAPIDTAIIQDCDPSTDLVRIGNSHTSDPHADDLVNGLPISSIAIDGDACWCTVNASSLTMTIPIGYRVTGLVLQGGVNPAVSETSPGTVTNTPDSTELKANATALPCGVSIASCDGNIELTAAALGDVMDWSHLLKSNPPEKFLKRPPVRFLFDLIHFIAQSNPGLMPAELTDAEWSTVGQDKNTKLEFMNKMITFVTEASKQSQPVQEASAIVTGSNPELTNTLLQQLALVVYCFQKKIELVVGSDASTDNGPKATQNSVSTMSKQQKETWITKCAVQVSTDENDKWQEVTVLKTDLVARDQAVRLKLPPSSELSTARRIRIVPLKWHGQSKGSFAAMRLQLLGFNAQKSIRRQDSYRGNNSDAAHAAASEQEMIVVDSSLLTTVLRQLLDCVAVMIEAVDHIEQSDEAVKEHKQQVVRRNMENLAKEKLALEELLAKEKQSLESNNQDLAEQLKNCFNQLRETKQLLEKEQEISRQLDETCKQLREGKHSAQLALTEKENDNAQMKTELLKLQANAEKDTNSIVELQAMLKEQEVALETAKEQLQQAEEAHSVVEQERDDLASQINVLTEERDAARAQEEDLFEKLTERTFDLERLQESYVNIADRCNDAQDEVMDLREKVESLQEAFANRAALQSVLPAAPVADVSSPYNHLADNHSAMPKTISKEVVSSPSIAEKKVQLKAHEETGAKIISDENARAEAKSPTKSIASGALNSDAKAGAKSIPLDKKPSANLDADYNDDFDDYEDEFETDD